MKLSELKPYEDNPRINDHAVDAVAASIREFGFKVPIVADADGVIAAGHTRWKAARKLGLHEVPVVLATDLTPEQIRAFRIADNKTAALSDWNYDLLPIGVADLQEMNYDLGQFGFDPDELAKLLDPGVKEGLADPDDVPEPPDEAITQPGDLWILGEHRLLCGDSANPEHVDRLLGCATIQLVNTDPPYGVKVEPRSNNAIAAGLSSFTNDAAVQKLKSGRGNAAFDIARGTTKGGNTHHPVLTRKDFMGCFELAARAIQYSSRTGENVLDLFGGSGSTLIGCEQTGRKAFLMGIDPPYCDVIVRRYEQFTGQKAKRIPGTDDVAE